MVKLFPILGVCLSLISLILLAIAIATNKWVVLDQTDSKLNPRQTNSKLGTVETRIGITSSTSEIQYSFSNFGLWIGCVKEHKGAVTCSYIGTSCSSDICWIRKTTVSTTKTCQETRVEPIRSCGIYQFIRGMTAIGLILMVFGVAIQLVSIFTMNRRLAMLAGLVLFPAGIIVMTSFAVFHSQIWVKSGLENIAHIGYSFKLLTASWPLSLISALISCCAASMGLRHKEVSDYSASNY